ncbi:MAG: NAD(P)/FAD-dependent oxidoreductase [Eubacterium sp.]|nr:NAD(P)/FAD-dependent oxidoreductase [Eubacterium sp.]
MKTDLYDLAIVGAGASGIFAAITAARRGCCVVLIEHTEQIGKKILSTGNGRCNFSNSMQAPACYRSSSSDACFKVIEAFDSDRLQAFFHEMGMLVTDKEGYLYPATLSSATVLDLFKMELEQLKVKIKTNTKLHTITKKQDVFSLVTDTGFEMKAKNVLLSTGSKAASFTGSDGSGYELAQSFGHTIIPVVPALTGIESTDPFFRHIPKLRFDGSISVWIEDECVGEEAGQLQLSDYGISGIAAFQLSRFASYALTKKQKVKMRISFVMMEASKLQQELESVAKQRANLPARKFLVGFIDSKLVIPVLQRLKIDSKKKVEEITSEEIQAIIQFLTEAEFEVSRTRNFRDAQVCAGGVSLEEISLDRMESKFVEGLYLAGEVLDVDGICGGYNLQWAFSSAYVAASHLRL